MAERIKVIITKPDYPHTQGGERTNPTLLSSNHRKSERRSVYPWDRDKISTTGITLLNSQRVHFFKSQSQADVYKQDTQIWKTDIISLKTGPQLFLK